MQELLRTFESAAFITCNREKQILDNIESIKGDVVNNKEALEKAIRIVFADQPREGDLRNKRFLLLANKGLRGRIRLIWEKDGAFRIRNVGRFSKEQIIVGARHQDRRL